MITAMQKEALSRKKITDLAAGVPLTHESDHKKSCPEVGVSLTFMLIS